MQAGRFATLALLVAACAAPRPAVDGIEPRGGEPAAAVTGSAAPEVLPSASSTPQASAATAPPNAPPPAGLEALLAGAAACDKVEVIERRCAPAEKLDLFGLHTLEAPEDPGIVPLLVARLSAPSASERIAAARRLATARLGILPRPVALDAAQKIFARVAEEDDSDAALHLYDTVSFVQWSDVGEATHAWEALGRAKFPRLLEYGPGSGLFDDSAIEAATKLSLREDTWGDAALERFSVWSRDERAPAAVCERLAKATGRRAGKVALARSACEEPVLTFLGAVAERGRAGTADQGDAHAAGQACIFPPHLIKDPKKLVKEAGVAALAILHGKNAAAARKQALDSVAACDVPDLDGVLAKASRDAEPTVAAEAKQAVRFRAAVKNALRGTGKKQ